MRHRSILSVFGVLALVACSASNSNEPGSAASSSGATGSGAGSGIGVGNGTGTRNTSAGGSSNTGLNVSDDAGPDSGDVLNGVCANQSFNLQRKPAEILIVLDRSESMQIRPDGQPSGSASKWSLVVPGVNQVVTSTAAAVSWGLKTFPEGNGSECATGSVTNAIPVAIAPNNAVAVTAGVTATTPAGNGTPTGDAINAAVKYLQTLTDANPKFILLATDGEPSCAGTTKGSSSARTFAVQAVTDAATAGFKTFVVGVATTKTSATQALNDMAVAGQEARAGSNTSATKFYLASTQDELVTSLQTITGQVASCTFDLTAVPPDPNNIAVHVNDTKAPQDTTKTNGWDYTGSDMKQIQVYGSWCDQIKAADSNTVTIVFGCPGQPSPA